MLLNLSNHPSTHWPDEQKNAALQKYGKIHDLAFPQIPPEADENDIEALADEFSNKCLQLLQQTTDIQNAVHLMGEMTFSFALVARLQKNGITCIASTTNRLVKIENEHEKTVIFQFVRFRNYLKNV
jgi:hypothetical protein